MKKIKKVLTVILTVALCLTMLPFSITANAAGQTSITLKQSEDYYFHDGWDRASVKLSADGKMIYCVQPDLPAPPNGEYRTDNGKLREITPSDEKYEMYLKALYYGYGGAGFDVANSAFKTDSNNHQVEYSGNTPKAFIGNLKYSQYGYEVITPEGEELYYLMTHILLAYVNYGDSKMKNEICSVLIPSSWYDAVKELYNAIKKAPTPPTSMKLYMLDVGTQYQQVIIMRESIKLQLQKTNANSSVDYTSLAGAKYNIYLDSNCTDYFGYIVTDSNGFGKYGSETDGIDVPLQDYYCKEVTAPVGFELDTTVYQFKKTGKTTSDGTEIYNVTVSDVPYIKLELQKTSSCPDITENNHNYSLEGAVYTVYTDKACTKSANIQLKTNALGYSDYGKSIALKEGVTYYCKETKAPEGYKLDDTVYQFKDSGSVSSDGVKIYRAYSIKDGSEPSDEPYNDPVYILVQKENAAGVSSSDNFEGAEFTVKFYDGYYYTEAELSTQTPERTWVLSTDKDGFCGLNNSYLVSGDSFYYNLDDPNPCLPLGTVSVQETKAPDNGKYEINTEVFIRQITVDGISTGIFTSNPIIVPETEILGKLTIAKSAEDSTRKNNTAKDVWFNVKSDDGLVDTNIVTVASSGTEGAVTLDNLAIYKDNGEYVQYTITELGYKNADGTFSVPDRYVKPEPKVVTLEKSTSVYCYFNNRLEKTGLIVQKKSEDGIVSGFYFSVISDDGKVNRTVVTGEDGTASLTNLSVYNSNSEKIKYTIKELGFKNEDGTYSIPDRYYIPSAKTVTLEDGKSITVTINNYLKRGSVELTKTDADENIIEGITFELYNSNNTLVELVQESVGVYRPATEDDTDTVKVAVTDDLGGFFIDMLLPGKYYFVEVDSKEYMPYSKKIEFTISAENTETLEQYITVKNNKIVMAETGGKGSNREIMINIGYIMLAVSVLTGSTALFMKNKKKHSKKAQ